MVWCNGKKCFQGDIISLRTLLRNKGYEFGMIDCDSFQARIPGEEFYALYQNERDIASIPYDIRHGLDPDIPSMSYEGLEEFGL